MIETQTATAAKWVLDASHSEITFKVKHMMVSNVTGGFDEFSVDADINQDDFTKSKVAFTTKLTSVNTGAEDRDNHLRSADFFDVENHPEMTFTSNSIEKVDNENYTMNGNLVIKGIEKPVSLNVEVGGFGKDPWGNKKAGFTVSGKINRKDWDLTWNAALEAGGVLVGDEIKINCEIQLMEQA